MAKPITRAKVMAAVAGLPVDARNTMVCQIAGHSRIVTRSSTLETLRYCARCGSVTPLSSEHLVVGSVRTMANRAKLKAMTWKDKMYAPENPLTGESC